MADVGCAGILVADTFCGPMKRLPAEGELLAVDRMVSRAGGCAANVAIDLVKQGFVVDVCGCVGTDSAGDSLLQDLKKCGVGVGQIQRQGDLPTSRTVILLVEGQDRRYVHVFGANAGLEVSHIRHAWIDGLKVFYFGGLFAAPAICAAELAKLLAYCRERGVVTVVDVVVPQEYQGMEELDLLLPLIDYFVPNADEATRLTGCSDIEQQAARFLEGGAGTVIITNGERGSMAARGTRRWQADAFDVQCVDPSGAGDAFAAGVITGVLRGLDLADILRLAAALGAAATTAVGTADGVLDAQQAQEFLNEHALRVVCREKGE